MIVRIEKLTKKVIRGECNHSTGGVEFGTNIAHLNLKESKPQLFQTNTSLSAVPSSSRAVNRESIGSGIFVSLCKQSKATRARALRVSCRSLNSAPYKSCVLKLEVSKVCIRHTAEKIWIPQKTVGIYMHIRFKGATATNRWEK